MLENPDSNALDFVDDFKMNLFSDEIFVFTPAGDLKTLPINATPLDFAFEIHTQVGSKCLGSKVNGKLVPLSYSLKSGDQVEIITSNKQKPKEDWLSFVKTSRAKSKIKNALKEEKKRIGKEGKEILQRKLKHIKIPFNNKTETDLIRFFHLKTSLDLYYQFGAGMLTNKDIRSFATKRDNGWYGYIKNKISGNNNPKNPKSVNIEAESTKDHIVLFGVEKQQLEYKLAKCCSPISGDDIFGFTTINEGIKVHSNNCPNAIQLHSRYAYRILNAQWTNKDNIHFKTKLHLSGIDQLGLINNVTRIISNQLNVNIDSINISTKDGVFEGYIAVNVFSKIHLSNLINKLQKIDGINNVERL